MKNINMKKWLSHFVKEEEGASGIEYALIAVMVAVVLTAFTGPISAKIETIFNSISGAL